MDSDCGPGGYCSPSMETCPFSATNPDTDVESHSAPNPYYWHTASDLCLNDSDCASLDAGRPVVRSSYPSSGTCAYNRQDNRWECAQFACPLP